MLPPPPAVALAAALAQRALTRGAPPPPTRRKLVASGMAAAAGALPTAAARQFHRQGTTENPFHPDRATALVTTGVNARTRNPMYLGLTGVLVANAVRRGSWRALLPVIAFVVTIDRTQVAAEEAALLANFGAEYEAYRAAVPRWVGLRR